VVFEINFLRSSYLIRMVLNMCYGIIYDFKIASDILKGVLHGACLSCDFARATW